MATLPQKRTQWLREVAKLKKEKKRWRNHKNNCGKSPCNLCGALYTDVLRQQAIADQLLHEIGLLSLVQ